MIGKNAKTGNIYHRNKSSLDMTNPSSVASGVGSFLWEENQQFTMFVKMKLIDDGVNIPGVRSGSNAGVICDISRTDDSPDWWDNENKFSMNIRNTTNAPAWYRGDLFLLFYGNRLGGITSYWILRYQDFTSHAIPNEWNYMQITRGVGSFYAATLVYMNGTNVPLRSYSVNNAGSFVTMDAPNQQLHLGVSASSATPEVTQFAGEFAEFSVVDYVKTPAQMAADRAAGTQGADPNMIFASFENLDVDGCTPHVYAKNVAYDMKGIYQLKDYGKIIPSMQ